jgi:hypothetical protein
MKKLISHALLTTLLVSTTPAMSQVKHSEVYSVKASVSSNSTFDVLFSNYKKAIMVDGLNSSVASEDFLKGIQAAQLNAKDIKKYALTNMSTENYLEFSKALEGGIMSLNGKAISEKKLVRLVTKLVAQEQREGANWISCGAGLGIGIPLLVAGIVTGIVALSMKEVKTSEIERKYIDLRKQALDNYTADEINRQDSIIDHESDIAAYGSAVEELERRITSGVYGALEIEQMQQEIASLGVNTSDSQASIAQLVNDQPQLEASYQDQVAHLAELEGNESSGVVAENARIQRSQKMLGITTAISMPIGLALVLGATNNSDC